MTTRSSAFRTRKTLTLLALLALSGSALAGCGNRDDDGAAARSASGTTSASASAGPTATASATPTPPVSPGVTGGPAMGTPLCAPEMLSGTVESIPGGASAGGVSRALVLTNTSDSRCAVMGYPGVSYLDAAGQQVGAAAGRIEGSAATTVTMEPGQSAAAEMRETVAQKYGGCQVQPTASLLVYPPENTGSLTVPYPSTGCLNGDIELLQVGVFQAR